MTLSLDQSDDSQKAFIKTDSGVPDHYSSLSEPCCQHCFKVSPCQSRCGTQSHPAVPPGGPGSARPALCPGLDLAGRHNKEIGAKRWLHVQSSWHRRCSVWSEPVWSDDRGTEWYFTKHSREHMTHSCLYCTQRGVASVCEFLFHFMVNSVVSLTLKIWYHYSLFHTSWIEFRIWCCFHTVEVFSSTMPAFKLICLSSPTLLSSFTGAVASNCVDDSSIYCHCKLKIQS